MDFNAKKEYLFRKQSGKKNLSAYDRELNSILNTTKGSYEILDLETSDMILQKSASLLDKVKPKKYQCAFDKKENFLLRCFSKCNELLPVKVYLYLNYSKDCGLALIDSLLMIKTNFGFSSEHAGIIVLISENLKNKIVLDYYEENNEYLMEIELFGEAWSVIDLLH